MSSAPQPSTSFLRRQKVRAHTALCGESQIDGPARTAAIEDRFVLADRPRRGACRRMIQGRIAQFRGASEAPNPLLPRFAGELQNEAVFRREYERIFGDNQQKCQRQVASISSLMPVGPQTKT